MLLLPVAVLLGALAALVAPPGGRAQRVRAVPVLVAGAALQAAVDLAGVTLPGALAVLAAAALLAGTVANLRLVGATVVAAGLAANLVVAVANGGTPVRAEALEAAGAPAGEPGGGRHLAGDGTRLAVLGDVVPVTGGLVVSFGDLVALVGLADVTAHAVRARRRRAVRDGVVVDLRALERQSARREAVAVDREDDRRSSLRAG